MCSFTKNASASGGQFAMVILVRWFWDIAVFYRLEEHILHLLWGLGQFFNYNSPKPELIYTVSQKNDNDAAHYNFNAY